MGRPPLTRMLDVRMNGRLVGHYGFSPSGGTSFQYAGDWLDWENRFAISRQLPLDTGVQRGAHVTAVFENLLPDNPDLRRLIAERTEARSPRPHDLLAAIGRDCIGALHFLPPDSDPGDPFRLDSTPRSEAQIARTLRNLASAPLGLDGQSPFRISLAGAQEKTAFLRRDGAWHQPLGVAPTTHIFKRPMGLVAGQIDLSDSVENEYLCLRIAGALGLPVNQAEIARFEDQKALVITRFDRGPRARGGMVRLPQEDFLQALGLESGQKYQQHGGPDFRACVSLAAGSIDRAGDMKLLLKAQVVFWMLTATDGHAKNFSLHLGPGGYRMTPLYDILSAAPHAASAALRHREVQLAMSVGQRRHYRIDQVHTRHFAQSAARAGIPPALAQDAFADLARPEALDQAAVGLPATFPDRVATPILETARQRMTLFTDALERGTLTA